MKKQAMRLASGIFGVALALFLVGQNALGQTGDNASTEKGSLVSKQDVRADLRPSRTFYLTNVVQPSEANEIVTAIRNTLTPDAKIYLVPSQNAIVLRASAEEFTLAQKLITELDRPKKAYRLVYTITEKDGEKPVGVQHFSMIVVSGQRTVMKQGSRVPIATGSFSSPGATGAQTQFTYLDVGMNFDATLDEFGNGVRLRTKVEQLGIAEQTSGVGIQDPVIRQNTLEGAAFLAAGKPLVLGSMDVTGSTRHLDVEVVMEPVR